MTQVFLLITPVLFSGIIYLIFPPNLHLAFYKIPIMLFIAVICGTLAIRFRGKVIISWFVILMRYNSRPRYYIANKNDIYLKDIEFEAQADEIKAEPVVKKVQKHRSAISLPDLLTLEQYISRRKASMSVKFEKKGKIYVSLSQS